MGGRTKGSFHTSDSPGSMEPLDILEMVLVSVWNGMRYYSIKRLSDILAMFDRRRTKITSWKLQKHAILLNVLQFELPQMQVLLKCPSSQYFLQSLLHFHLTLCTHLRSSLGVVGDCLYELDAGWLDLAAGLVVRLGRDGHRLPRHEGSPRQSQRRRYGTAL